MNSLARSVTVLGMTLVSVIAGLLLQMALPPQMLADAKGAILGLVGLVTLLLALVLGLLIWASYGVYSAQISEAQSLGPVVLDLDYTLKLYGPETAKLREGLKQATLRARERFFGGGHAKPISFTLTDSRNAVQYTNDLFNALKPATDEQRELLATAKQLRTTVIQTDLRHL
jgi:hypothetical protein